MARKTSFRVCLYLRGKMTKGAVEESLVGGSEMLGERTLSQKLRKSRIPHNIHTAERGVGNSGEVFSARGGFLMTFLTE